VVIDTHGFTQREVNVFEGIASGLAAKHIARELRISSDTVNAHLKSMYRKAGVSGREELMGRLT